MNLFIATILLSVLFVLAKGQTFVNFLPFEDYNCDQYFGQGLGYSFQSDICITGISIQDNVARGNIKVTVSDNTDILVELFNLDDTSCSSTAIDQWKYTNGTCVPYNLGLIHFTFGFDFGANQNLMAVISDGPIYKKGTIVFENYVQQQQQSCDTPNLIYSTTLTNPYQLIDNSTIFDKTFFYKCDNSNKPYTQICRDENMFCESKVYIGTSCANSQTIYCTSSSN